MIDYKYADLYAKDSVSKQLLIKTDDGLVEITNVDLHYEQFELSESLCSESELRFGCCEASSLKFRLSDIFTPLKDKWLTVTETLDKNTDVSFLFGRYKVYSDKPTADRRYRNIVAYDAMHDIINANVADWYNTILPNLDSTVTMKEFRTSFISHFGLEQEDVELVNDGMVIEKTIEPSEISGKDVITAICELNGCFGHIGRDGKFKYVFLTKKSEELYPADDLYPAEDLFIPASNAIEIKKNTYISCHYEDFVTSNIKKLQIRKEENDIGAIVGTDGNCYIVEDNFLVYGKAPEELEQIATNLLSVITDVVYRPFDASVKGNPCLEVGDKVSLKTKYEVVESYILKRTLKGIQALRDTFEADGAEYYTEKVNSVQRSIIQLKGKTNVLERDVERTKSSITNLETKLENDYLTEIETKSVIEQSANEINLEVSKKVGNEEIISKINQTAESIKISAERIDVDGVLDAEKINALEIKAGSVDAENITGETIRGKTIDGGKILSGEGTQTISIEGGLLDFGGTARMTCTYGRDNEETGEEEIVVANVFSFAPNGRHTGLFLDIYANNIDITGDTLSLAFSGDSLYQDYGIEIDATVKFLQTAYIKSGAAVTSDRDCKNTISELDRKKSAQFIYSLKPSQFKYNDGKSDRFHHGLIAQEVKESMGVDDWGVYIDANPKKIGCKALRYEELIADLIATVQTQNERIKKIEERLGVADE